MCAGAGSPRDCQSDSSTFHLAQIVVIRGEHQSCFISWRLQSKTMNTRSQGTKTEIDDDLSSFYVSAVVGSSVNSLKCIDQA